MRHILIRASVLGFLAFGAGVAYAVSTGPPASRTNSPAFAGRPSEPNCTVCHTNAAINSGGGRVRLFGIPAHYTPNSVYPITVQLEHPLRVPPPPDSLNWGFQMQACQKNSGNAAGQWILGPNFAPDTFKITTPSQVVTNPLRFRRYISHTRNATNPARGSLRRGENGPVTWTLNWQAPAGDSGMVYFFVAGNAANGDFTSFAPSEDFIYSTYDSTNFGTDVDVPPTAPWVFSNGLQDPYPNPMSACTSVDFTIGKGGLVDIGVFDLQGRRVRTLLHEFRPVGYHALDWNGRGNDGAFVRNGVYFIRMLAPGMKTPATQKVTFAR